MGRRYDTGGGHLQSYAYQGGNAHQSERSPDYLRLLIDFKHIVESVFSSYFQKHSGSPTPLVARRGVSEEPGTEEIVQRNLYYPFGMSVNRDWWQNAPAPVNVTDQDYRYNGKELETQYGLDWYFYGARMYDPAVGRFTGVDPIAEQFAFVSVYNYAENEPVRHIDLWGLQRHLPKVEGESAHTGPISSDFINEWEQRNFCATEENGCTVTLPPIEQSNETLELSYDNLVSVDNMPPNGKIESVPFFFELLTLGSGFGRKGLQGAISRNSANHIARQATSKVDDFIKMLNPIDKVDELILYRGTTGSEATKRVIYLTSDPTVARTYVKNGGSVVQYRVSRVAVEKMQWNRLLEIKTGIHGPTGKINHEYMFTTPDVVKALNAIREQTLY